MATTTQSYQGDGSKGIAGQTQLTFPFPYLKTEDIKVSLNGKTLATTKYTFPTATSIQFVALGGSPTAFETATQETTGAPKSGVQILFYRDTDVDAAKSIFASGSAYRASDLNNNKDQSLYFQQEVEDGNNPKVNKDSLILGTSVPTGSVGKEGDIYIDTTGKNIYGPKANAEWGSAKPIGGSSVLDEDNMSSNSATLPPSQQSVKAYVDSIPWLDHSTKTNGSVIYYNTTASKFKADAAQTLSTIVDGGSWN